MKLKTWHLGLIVVAAVFLGVVGTTVFVLWPLLSSSPDAPVTEDIPDELRAVVEDNSRLTEQLGAIQSVELDQAASVMAEDNVSAYRIRGDRASGLLTVKYHSPETGKTGAKSATLQTDDGRTFDVY